MKNIGFVPDESQREVLEADGGFHLVLASPGCGKTQILSERVRLAHRQGVPFADMLCLTFTNRAARGMFERIHATVGDDDSVEQMFVGNVHRFCSRFLFAHELVAADSAIIDDEETVSIIARYLDEDEEKVNGDFHRRRYYSQVMQLSHLVHQVVNGHPREVRLHPEALEGEDVASLQQVCGVQRMAFTPQALDDIYRHADFYLSQLDGEGYRGKNVGRMRQTLQKLSLAHSYEKYKADHHLLDFEDLLILTFDILQNDSAHQYPRYRWVQVDEVQDLNPLQLSLVDLLTAPGATVMYLGDEQQAIFSFMGAKLDGIERLRSRCSGHIHHLGVNHRSPSYLLRVFNDYAEKLMGISPELLPVAADQDGGQGNELRIVHSNDMEDEFGDVGRMVAACLRYTDTETMAVIVNSNSDAQRMSETLQAAHIPHFKISGDDMFSTPEVKCLFAHFDVLSNELNFMAWTRIVRGLGVLSTSAACRAFVQGFKSRAMMPSDVLVYDSSTYMNEFVEAADAGDIVVFDTETTGLNVFEDDILQIAAKKMRGGRIVPGSGFCVYLRSDRPIPAMLGDVVNPIIEERKHHELLPPAEGISRFLAYAEGCVLLGHNADYDYHILSENMRRCLPGRSLEQLHPVCFDSLRIIRLLRPDLKRFKLKSLLEELGLEGQNSHLADDDVFATCSLVAYCLDKAREVVPRQREWLQGGNVKAYVTFLRQYYQQLYLHDREILYHRHLNGSEPILVEEMRSVYKWMRLEHRFHEVRGFGHILDYLAQDLIDAKATPSLKEQIDAHVVELNTLKEADLCGSSSMNERVYVTTVHKAKGLEYDNVFIFDAVDGRYPNYYTKGDERMVKEDARKFYVALSRARKRIRVCVGDIRYDYKGGQHPRDITPFMLPIAKYFTTH